MCLQFPYCRQIPSFLFQNQKSNDISLKQKLIQSHILNFEFFIERHDEKKFFVLNSRSYIFKNESFRPDFWPSSVCGNAGCKWSELRFKNRMTRQSFNKRAFSRRVSKRLLFTRHAPRSLGTLSHSDGTFEENVFP